ncbi:lipid A biosynthesis lauroyl acyltransferase [Helicobacter sp.]|uniref:lipid A biosynthesis lauroyl acyltransferase n=1 Tax=Helicobacter sp. TaxID=218 RepID=UPI0025B962FB|nr:lipid A biosynthesis lauroyl acyltransferase [Helicobacter sp.]MCI5633581.1 lipid A biosynthesis lauroyl acyltransferase [Helicobacter sp.]MDY5556993.1 lipid A biosynthesis lauroyl acyltransferase [Helicobacter sp.]
MKPLLFLKEMAFFSSLKVLGYLFLFMPHCLRLGFAKGIAFILYCLDSRRKFDLMANLNFAYNNALEDSKKREILKINYLNLVYNSISFFMLAVSNKEHILKTTCFENEEIIESLLQKGEKIIFTTAHYGNWEYTTPAFTCTFNHPIVAVARMTPSALINAYLIKTRSKFQVKILDKQGAMLRLVKALNKSNVVGIVTDQNTANSEGLLVKFFGKNVRHTPIASILALKYDAKIVHVFASYSQDYRKIIIKILPPLEFQKTENLQDDIQNLTQLQSDILEKTIRENPKEWLWFHKKFKNQYPEIYRH